MLKILGILDMLVKRPKTGSFVKIPIFGYPIPYFGSSCEFWDQNLRSDFGPKIHMLNYQNRVQGSLGIIIPVYMLNFLFFLRLWR